MRTLKIALLATVATAALSSATIAADLIISDPIIDNTFAPAFDWEGAYAGLWIGGLTNPGVFAIGADLGVNAMIDSSLLAGFEGNVDWQSNSTWEGQVHARLGFVADSALFYGLVGVGAHRRRLPESWHLAVELHGRRDEHHLAVQPSGFDKAVGLGGLGEGHRAVHPGRQPSGGDLGDEGLEGRLVDGEGVDLRPLGRPPQVRAGSQSVGGRDQRGDVLRRMAGSGHQPYRGREPEPVSGPFGPHIAAVDRPEIVEASAREMVERGLQPEVLAGRHVAEAATLQDRGALWLAGGETEGALLVWHLAGDTATWAAGPVLARVDELAAASLDEKAAETCWRRYWLQRAPRYMGRRLAVERGVGWLGGLGVRMRGRRVLRGGWVGGSELGIGGVEVGRGPLELVAVCGRGGGGR